MLRRFFDSNHNNSMSSAMETDEVNGWIAAAEAYDDDKASPPEE